MKSFFAGCVKGVRTVCSGAKAVCRECVGCAQVCAGCAQALCGVRAGCAQGKLVRGITFCKQGVIGIKNSPVIALPFSIT